MPPVSSFFDLSSASSHDLRHLFYLLPTTSSPLVNIFVAGFHSSILLSRSFPSQLVSLSSRFQFSSLSTSTPRFILSSIFLQHHHQPSTSSEHSLTLQFYCRSHLLLAFSTSSSTLLFSSSSSTLTQTFILNPTQPFTLSSSNTINPQHPSFISWLQSSIPLSRPFSFDLSTSSSTFLFSPSSSSHNLHPPF